MSITSVSRIVVALALLVAPAAHADERYRFIDQPAEGYEAIRFNRHVTFENILARNDLTFEAGATLVNDRVLTETGVPLFCGSGAMNNGWHMTYCVSVDGQSFTLPEYPRASSIAPPGSFSRFRLRLD